MIFSRDSVLLGTSAMEHAFFLFSLCGEKITQSRTSGARDGHGSRHGTYGTFFLNDATDQTHRIRLSKIIT